MSGSVDPTSLLKPMMTLQPTMTRRPRQSFLPTSQPAAGPSALPAPTLTATPTLSVSAASPTSWNPVTLTATIVPSSRAPDNGSSRPRQNASITGASNIIAYVGISTAFTVAAAVILVVFLRYRRQAMQTSRDGIVSLDILRPTADGDLDSQILVPTPRSSAWAIHRRGESQDPLLRTATATYRASPTDEGAIARLHIHASESPSNFIIYHPVSSSLSPPLDSFYLSQPSSLGALPRKPEVTSRPIAIRTSTSSSAGSSYSNKASMEGWKNVISNIYRVSTSSFLVTDEGGFEPWQDIRLAASS